MARRAAEDAWRAIYGQVFQGRPRCRRGGKAEYEYQREPCMHYRVVPFPADVPGLPMDVLGHQMDAYECRGPLVPLGAFRDVEFFVCPMDFAWTMIHTHEDYGFGGPYFIRAEWVCPANPLNEVEPP